MTKSQFVSRSHRQLESIIQPLENGDRLTRLEFERRYHAMPDIKKAELVEGIVYIGSPVPMTQHGEPHASVMGWLLIYKASTPGIQLGDNCTVKLDLDNQLQPDALLRIQSGQSTISEDGYVEGAPELIVEVAASTVSIDVHEKLKVYRRNQVQEYLIWRFEDNALDWFQLRNGEYVLLQPDETGILKSEVFPGLWLNSEALLTGNLIKVIEIVQQGIAAAEHQSFVQNLLK
ncbi:MAG: Uma2 family endonuclease [Microcoleaceae cyanobacterium]